jgi:hypothetical protein
VTITLYGELAEVERVRAMLDDLEALSIDKAEGPLRTADGSGRFRLYLAVRV